MNGAVCNKSFLLAYGVLRGREFGEETQVQEVVKLLSHCQGFKLPSGFKHQGAVRGHQWNRFYHHDHEMVERRRRPWEADSLTDNSKDVVNLVWKRHVLILFPLHSHKRLEQKPACSDDTE